MYTKEIVSLCKLFGTLKKISRIVVKNQMLISGPAESCDMSFKLLTYKTWLPLRHVWLHFIKFVVRCHLLFKIMKNGIFNLIIHTHIYIFICNVIIYLWPILYFVLIICMVYNFKMETPSIWYYHLRKNRKNKQILYWLFIL